MIRRATTLAIVLSLVGAATGSAAWREPVTGPVSTAGLPVSNDAGLASVNGVPYVAWSEASGADPRQLHVARLSADGTAWERVGEASNATSPINESPTRGADSASVTAIDGVPYVTWIEPDSLSFKVRVARLNAAGTAWEKVGQGLNSASPINQAANRNASSPSLIGIGGLPYVAWSETDGAGDSKIRVARLNVAGTGWDKLGQSSNPASPINAAGSDAYEPTLIAVGGVPYVSFEEDDGPGTSQIRVARLNAAGTAWERVGETTPALQAAPINQTSTTNAYSSHAATIGGVPYVAWGEDSAVRVARLNADGSAWEKVGQAENPELPINQADEFAETPELEGIGGIPYVVWKEDDEANVAQIRVARLNAAGTGWEKVAGGPAPLNVPPTRGAGAPVLTSIGGIPYVVFRQGAGTQNEIRASRLEPEFISQSAAAGPTTATLSATWRTYGVEFPIGFDYGTALEASTTPATAPAYTDSPTLTQQVSGLAEQTPFQFRSFASAGAGPPLLGEVGSFTTTDGTAPETTITKDPKAKSSKSKAKYKFTSSEPNSTFVCKFDKKKPKPCDAGKAKFKRLDDGKHKFKVYAVDAAGNQDQSPAKDKFKVL